MPDKIPAVLKDQAATDRHWRERLQDTVLMIFPISGDGNSSLKDFWSAAVLSYTSCDLTKESDKLKAFLGIAKLVRDALSAIEVGSRMTGYQNYKVTDHDEQPLTFKVKNRLHARHVQSNYTRWHDELSFMTAELAQKQVKVVSEIKKAGLNSEPMPRSQPGAALVEKAKSPHADTMPELENATLDIQGHISRGRMVKLSDEKTWQIVVQNSNGSTSSIEAFPDEPPEAEGTECMFVVLSACFHDEYDSAYYCSGKGIMVKFDGDHHYRRIGAIAFRDLMSESWDTLRHQSCDRTVEEGEHSLETGSMFYLD
ncbi:hypothetical protein F4782DRAFT_552496 [Xylaria castorea]|nr:hypothetical protein F4782DRAFT_552496 [Xylaria castorea]